MTHHCHANGCTTPTDPSLFMCRKHWSMLQPQMQRNVWNTYKKRGNVPGKNPQGWVDYYDACAVAVEYVAKMEGKDIENSYRRVAHALRKREAAL